MPIIKEKVGGYCVFFAFFAAWREIFSRKDAKNAKKI